MKIGGWSRIGIVVTALWLFGVATFAAVEYAAKKDDAGLLVSWEQNKPKPWEIDWSKSPPVKSQIFDPDAYMRSQGMTQAEIDAIPYLPVWHWKRLLSLTLGVPALLWLVTAFGALAIRWIRAGFRDSEY